MPVHLSIKNVPDDIAEQLRRRAAANRRSLQRELLRILETAVGRRTRADAAAPPSELAEQDAISIAELDALSRRLFPRETESSVAYLRQQRDSR